MTSGLKKEAQMSRIYLSKHNNCDPSRLDVIKKELIYNGHDVTDTQISGNGTEEIVNPGDYDYMIVIPPVSSIQKPDSIKVGLMQDFDIREWKRRRSANTIFVYCNQNFNLSGDIYLLPIEGLKDIERSGNRNVENATLELITDYNRMNRYVRVDNFIPSKPFINKLEDATTESLGSGSFYGTRGCSTTSISDLEKMFKSPDSYNTEAPKEEKTVPMLAAILFI